jgi:hypothetical protein
MIKSESALGVVLNRLLLLLPLLFLSGCDSSASSAGPASVAALKEMEIASDTSPEDAALVTEARSAVSDYIRPIGELHGIATNYYVPNCIVATADYSVAGKRQSVNLIARKFVGEDGKAYWMVHPLQDSDLTVFSTVGKWPDANADKSGDSSDN